MGTGTSGRDGAPLVRMRGICKRFAGVVALDGVDLELRRGEVMALVGENGAGKSTLLKILAGAQPADQGTTEVGGEPVDLGSPKLSQSHGIAVIHQELNLAPHLSVAENIWAGREPRTRWGTVDFAAMRRTSAELMAQLSMTIDPRAPVATLSLARQQMVEIAKALSLAADVVVMDEPTSSLTEDEVGHLLDLVRALKARGVSVIYVSHRFREVFAVSDRITVLRDGRSVGGVLQTASTSPDEVIGLMVGREIGQLFGEPGPGARSREAVLSVSHLASGSKVKDVSFDLYPGEILGVAGLVGAGRSETARAIFAVDPLDAGTVALRGRPVRWRSPRDAIAAGVALVPEDRKGTGLFLDLPVRVNMASAATRAVSRWGLLRGGAERALTREYCSRLNLRANSLDRPVRFLSGGNQQKAVLARWLAMDPSVLLLDEPTRGVDVGAKSEIYALVRSIAASGVAVLMISSELTEVLGMSDRVLVLHEGRVAGELRGADADEATVMRMATGVHEEVAA